MFFAVCETPTTLSRLVKRIIKEGMNKMAGGRGRKKIKQTIKVAKNKKIAVNEKKIKQRKRQNMKAKLKKLFLSSILRISHIIM